MDPNSEDRILLAHGGGGELTSQLIDEHILPRLGNPTLNGLDDGAVLELAGASRVCMTTDSFVVQPLEFPGGDIGRLAVCGTVNDLAMMGARPLALSLGLIIEEGLPMATLDRMLDSLAEAAREAGVSVVTGDTKVIERSRGEGMLINTTGIGLLPENPLPGIPAIRSGDRLLLSGGIAEHGLAVMSQREGLAFQTPLLSDAAPLGGLVQALLDAGVQPRFLRDPTRGGLAGVVAELAGRTGLGLELREEAIPILPAARHIAELLGLDPLTIANEGKLIAVVAEEDAERALAALREHPLGRRAAEIGLFLQTETPLAELITRAGGRRIVQQPYGEELPRIC